MRYITFSFDDAFEKSTIKTVEIFESYGLVAEINAVAQYSLEQNEFAGFDLLNRLRSRGHIIQTHGYSHKDKGQCPFGEAVESVEKCIETFSENLEGFDPVKSIFCFPYNSSNEKIEEYVSSRFRAFRTGYNKVINEIPDGNTKMIFGDSWPDVCANIDKSIEEILAMDKGWLVYNVHGLDGEGWEPVTSAYLRNTLEFLLKQKNVKILPMISVLAENSDPL